MGQGRIADGVLAARNDARLMEFGGACELSRRLYLDTRFENDVDVDSDNDSTVMKYVDGGLTSDQSPPPGQSDQKARICSAKYTFS